MTAPQGPITGHAGRRGYASLTGSARVKPVTPRCPGPKVWWCPVENCTTDHPPRPDQPESEAP